LVPEVLEKDQQLALMETLDPHQFLVLVQYLLPVEVVGHIVLVLQVDPDYPEVLVEVVLKPLTEVLVQVLLIRDILAVLGRESPVARKFLVEVVEVLAVPARQEVTLLVEMAATEFLLLSQDLL
jgi:hypothetical protein